MLEVRNLVKTFGSLVALEDVSLAVGANTITGLIGPNGAGKTTLFDTIAGTQRADRGEVRLRGERIDGERPDRIFRRGLARTFQIPRPFPGLTVLENVMLAVQGVQRTKFVMWRPLSSYAGVRAKSQRLLERAGFWERRGSEIRHLSHGEQRQIEILLALASDPKLLLLDEPAAGLSSGESQEMATFLRALDPTLAILMIEHDLDVAFSVVDTIAVLHYGEMLEQGTTEQIRASTRVQEIYLGVR